MKKYPYAEILLGERNYLRETDVRRKCHDHLSKYFDAHQSGAIMTVTDILSTEQTHCLLSKINTLLKAAVEQGVITVDQHIQLAKSANRLHKEEE